MRHFIDLNNFKVKELRKIINFAKKIKKNKNTNKPILKNKCLGLIFEKQSIRTRLSFSIGIQKLGGHAKELDIDQIGFGYRETVHDILKTMSQYLDVLVIRNNNHKQLSEMADLNILPIINGLSDFSHPCQVLSDVFTIEENLGKIENKKIAWLGDFNNVLISLIHAAEIFKFKLNIIIPKQLHTKSKKILKKYSPRYCKLIDNFEVGLKNADCIMTDVWTSMGEKKSKAKIEILKKFQINNQIMQKAKKSAIFMHCLPANRNQEVTDSVIDGKQSIVWEQAKNRMYVQQSILYYILKDD